MTTNEFEVGQIVHYRGEFHQILAGPFESSGGRNLYVVRRNLDSNVSLVIEDYLEETPKFQPGDLVDWRADQYKVISGPHKADSFIKYLVKSLNSGDHRLLVETALTPND